MDGLHANVEWNDHETDAELKRGLTGHGPIDERHIVDEQQQGQSDVML